jgi:hypothetical protein
MVWSNTQAEALAWEKFMSVVVSEQSWLLALEGSRYDRFEEPV